MGCWLPEGGAVATTDSRVFSELRIDSAEQSDEIACISGAGGVMLSGFSMDVWVNPVALCMKEEEGKKRRSWRFGGVEVEVWGVVKIGQN